MSGCLAEMGEVSEEVTFDFNLKRCTRTGTAELGS